jgi:hypothetical protein
MIAQYQPLMIYPARAWLNMIEEYFNIYNVTIDEENVKYACMYLEADACNSYMWWKGGTQLYN